MSPSTEGDPGPRIPVRQPKKPHDFVRYNLKYLSRMAQEAAEDMSRETKTRYTPVTWELRVSREPAEVHFVAILVGDRGAVREKWIGL